MAIRMRGDEADTSLLLKTGQTTQYNSELDDGYYEMGIAKSYTIFTTGQYAGTTNVTVNAKTDVKSNNCVLDNRTTLMWSRYASASVGAGNDGKMAWTGQPDDIFAYCAAANAAGLAGYSDWRVPNVFECVSLRDYGLNDAVPDTTAFPSWPPGPTWTSTTRNADTPRALYWDWQGQFLHTAKTITRYCALVRGG